MPIADDLNGPVKSILEQVIPQMYRKFLADLGVLAF